MFKSVQQNKKKDKDNKYKSHAEMPAVKVN